MFADMELIGIPHMITIGEKNLAQGNVEYTERKSGEKQVVSVDNIVEFIKNITK